MAQNPWKPPTASTSVRGAVTREGSAVTIAVPNVRHPVVVWFGVVSAIGMAVMPIPLLQGARDAGVVACVYFAVGAPFWIALALRRTVRCEPDQVTLEAALPWVGRVRSTSHDLADARALRLRTSEVLGVFVTFEQHHPEIVRRDGSMVLPCAASRDDAREQVRAIAAVLGVEVVSDARLDRRAIPLLAHARFSTAVFGFLALFSAPWWIPWTPLDDGSLGADFHERTQVAFGVCLLFGVIAWTLFALGAWRYYGPRARAVAVAAAWTFAVLLAAPRTLEAYLWAADFESGFRAEGMVVGRPTLYAYEDTFDRPGLGLRRLPVTVEVGRDRWSHRVEYEHDGARHVAIVEASTPIAAATKVPLWVAAANPGHAVLDSRRDDARGEVTAHAATLGVLLASAGAAAVFATTRGRERR